MIQAIIDGDIALCAQPGPRRRSVWNVLTNRTLTVIGVAAFDGAAIWVAPVAE